MAIIHSFKDYIGKITTFYGAKMITKKTRNDKGYFDVKITDKNNNSFFMTVGGNLDLFWIPEDHKQNKIFEIAQHDELAFNIFNQLFEAIKKVDNAYHPVLNENTLTFISEDWHEDEANVLNITKTNDLFVITFIENTNRSAWSFPHRGCNICFCNSGSRVPKVETLFMKMFNYLAYYCDQVPCEGESEKQNI